MKKAYARVAAASILLVAGGGALAAQWSYNSKTDSFDNVEIKTATLAGVGHSFPRLQVVWRSDGANFAVFAGLRFKCFPQCSVRIKFDDAQPEVFEASTRAIVGHALFISDFAKFQRRVNESRVVVLRTPTYDLDGDLTFRIDAPINHDMWAIAKERRAAAAQCEAGSVTEDYSVCMARRESHP